MYNIPVQWVCLNSVIADWPIEWFITSSSGRHFFLRSRKLASVKWKCRDKSCSQYGLCITFLFSEYVLNSVIVDWPIPCTILAHITKCFVNSWDCSKQQTVHWLNWSHQFGRLPCFGQPRSYAPHWTWFTYSFTVSSPYLFSLVFTLASIYQQTASAFTMEAFSIG